jgi:hypothetical protein
MAEQLNKELGGYTALYKNAVKRIYDCYSVNPGRQVHLILIAYADHANEIGTCFPGMRVILDTSHYSQTTWERAMLVLSDLDYIRAHIEKSISRRREEVTYQISPYVLPIAPQWRDEAVSLWNSTSLRCNVIINEQRSTESESESSLKPPESTIPRTTTTTRTETPKTSRISPRNQPQGGQIQRVAQESGKDTGPTKNQRVAQEPPDRAKKRYVPPVPIELCRRPLDEDREKCAQALRRKVTTRISQARQLVAVHGIQNVDLALAWLDQERKNGREIINDFGLMKWWLDRQVIAEDERPERESLFGEYADYFDN